MTTRSTLDFGKKEFNVSQTPQVNKVNEAPLNPRAEAARKADVDKLVHQLNKASNLIDRLIQDEIKLVPLTENRFDVLSVAREKVRSAATILANKPYGPMTCEQFLSWYFMTTFHDMLGDMVSLQNPDSAAIELAMKAEARLVGAELIDACRYNFEELVTSYYKNYHR